MKYGVLLHTLYAELSVSVSIHWFSEFIAGIIFDEYRGFVVDEYFKDKTKGA